MDGPDAPCRALYKELLCSILISCPTRCISPLDCTTNYKRYMILYKNNSDTALFESNMFSFSFQGFHIGLFFFLIFGLLFCLSCVYLLISYNPNGKCRIVSRKPMDVWAVRLTIGTYLIDGKYFKPLELDEWSNPLGLWDCLQNFFLCSNPVDRVSPFLL